MVKNIVQGDQNDEKNVRLITPKPYNFIHPKYVEFQGNLKHKFISRVGMTWNCPSIMVSKLFSKLITLVIFVLAFLMSGPYI